MNILVRFYFSKAFDAILHILLFKKLKSLGFSKTTLTRICSYLTGRSQAVVGDDGVLSDWLLLFSLYIVDIRNKLKHAKSMVFPDDTQIYLSVPFSKLTEGLAQIAHDVNVISEYAALNELSLNIGKSKTLILESTCPMLLRNVDWR